MRAAIRVAPGERLALFGPSGAGKTTLLEVIAGLVAAAPRPGRAGRAGAHLDHPPARAVPPWQRRVGLLRQDPGLFPHLSVRANLALLAGRPTPAPPSWPSSPAARPGRAADRHARPAVRRAGPPGGARPAAAGPLRRAAAGRALHRAGRGPAPVADRPGRPAGHRARDPGGAGRARAAPTPRPSPTGWPSSTGRPAPGRPARRGGAAARPRAGSRSWSDTCGFVPVRPPGAGGAGPAGTCVAGMHPERVAPAPTPIAGSC